MLRAAMTEQEPLDACSIAANASEPLSSVIPHEQNVALFFSALINNRIYAELAPYARNDRVILHNMKAGKFKHYYAASTPSFLIRFPQCLYAETR